MGGWWVSRSVRRAGGLSAKVLSFQLLFQFQPNSLDTWHKCCSVVVDVQATIFMPQNKIWGIIKSDRPSEWNFDLIILLLAIATKRKSLT